MEHSKKQASQFLDQLKIALLRWQEEYLHDLKNENTPIITSVDGQAFNLPGDKYTDAFSLSYYMVRDPDVRAYLLENEVPKSGYQGLITDLLQRKESEERAIEISTILQKIIRSRTFYDIRGRADETSNKFKLKSKYQNSLSAYVKNWKTKLLEFEGTYYNKLDEQEALSSFRLSLNLYDGSAKIEGFHAQTPNIIYTGTWQRNGTFLNLSLSTTGRNKEQELKLVLYVAPQKKMEELTFIKGGFIGGDLDKETINSAEVFFQKKEQNVTLENSETANHLKVGRSLRLERNSLLLTSKKNLNNSLSDYTINFLHRYIGVYLIHRIHQDCIDTYVLRLYPDYRITFQHPDFFDGALMNCTVDMLNNSTVLRISVLHNVTQQVLMIILAKISDVKDVLVNQKQLMIDLTTPALGQEIISFNRKSKDASLEGPHLHTNRVKITELTDFNDLKEVDKLRK